MSFISGCGTPGRNTLLPVHMDKNELPLELLPKNGYVYLRGTNTEWIHEGVPGHICHEIIVGMIEDQDLRQYTGRVFINGQHWLKITLWHTEMKLIEQSHGYPFRTIEHGWVKYDDVNDDKDPIYCLYH